MLNLSIVFYGKHTIGIILEKKNIVEIYFIQRYFNRKLSIQGVT